MVSSQKGIAILGSTGSIGKQALEVIAQHPHHFRLEAITARLNADLLIEQAINYQPKHVVIRNEEQYEKVKAALSRFPIQVHAGEKALTEIVQLDTVDTVLTAMVGYAGLFPTIAAIRAGKQIALANKETLVVAGELVTRLAKKHGVSLYPVDSEHSAIFQCLVGEEGNPIEKIILTASGGPFRGKKRDFLASVTKEQ
ncbi:MAG: 1-deoxy-D-xylulose-5-phosphate reductoisomerase, partial [Flammeovirgaceae bacterium]|nr:1-deoxy-D-xylulose-5-phosphate reductoisomerase [Flammeovirgaceae bacterium]MDW8288545.1 1-deoxy-D-xylulose-5-phosphate reductoisomerase [Flammeovirgaceae bacterium]